MKLLDELIGQFQSVLDVAWVPPADLYSAATDAIQGCGEDNILGADQRRKMLFGLVNSKLGLNSERVRAFLDTAATRDIFFNYHDKAEIRNAFDHSDGDAFERWRSSRGFNEMLRELLNPLTPKETLDLLRGQLQHPTVRRSDARSCDPAERRNSILRSLFGSFVFGCFPAEMMHRHLNPDCRAKYFSDFYEHLQHFHPAVLHRHRALTFLIVDDKLHNTLGADLRNWLFHFIEQEYLKLSNHCYFAILIKPIRESREDGQWRLFSDLVLYAEKHRETTQKVGYFHPDKIEAATLAHVPALRPGDGRFEVANEGFFFRDCIVLPQQEELTVTTTSAPCDLLLLFEKNERDETLVPCPSCRSRNVRGNSYPTLGVKSWECNHPICPERSAFDRGNRYSVSALIRRQAVASIEDQIPEQSLRRWKLDVVPGANKTEVAEMLLRHFSLHGDTVRFVNTPHFGGEMLGRRLEYSVIAPTVDRVKRYENFQRSALFSRYVLERPLPKVRTSEAIHTGIEGVRVFRGDSFEVLSQLEPCTVDGAITSPPYYNARSYSAWPNIYCYLFDMYNVARQVYRVLRPGSYYLFNIFDYFDNENSIVFSAMGKKRMILGAYIINLFRRIGFMLAGNTVWYKGEIEGKRNYNQGNRSPYYQLPLNCWEHVFVFQKPGDHPNPVDFPTILAARPVIKMVRGQNTLGHSAPFPEAIPDLLVSRMKADEMVLDPFSGSMTTGRLARRRGLRSLSIDLHKEYCELGLSLLRQEENDARDLFRSMRRNRMSA